MFIHNLPLSAFSSPSLGRLLSFSSLSSIDRLLADFSVGDFKMKSVLQSVKKVCDIGLNVGESNVTECSLQ